VTAVVVGLLPGESASVEAMHVRSGWWRAGSAGVSAATGSEPATVATAVVALLLLARRRAADAAVVLAAVVAAVALGAGLKRVVERPRPELADVGDVSSYSYPSGHAAASTALLVAVVLVLRLRPPWLAAAGAVVLVVALAQLALGRHHPADLVAGWLVAVACVGSAEATRRGIRSGSMSG
jgi:membrane-associated phospholipid phosphatase